MLAEQIEYYRRRAPEYDDWHFRRGRYDRGAEATKQWFAEIAQVQDVLASLPIDDADVLELAPGTGIWTEQVCRRARRMVAVDASSEMVALNRQRLGSCADKVTYVLHDIFTYQPSEQFDAVLFTFWISHVPRARLTKFAQLVANACRPGAVVFFVDSLREHTSTAVEHRLPREGEELMVRQLDDGTRFTIVKAFHPDDLLSQVFREAGIMMHIRHTATYYQYGVGRFEGINADA